MKARNSGAVALEPVETVGTIRRVLGPSRRSDGPPETALPAQSIVSRLPAWVGRYAALRQASRVWLWCEPAAGADADPYAQATLDLPEGRYIISIFDTEAGEWVSRESAAGGPLVLSLPFTGAPMLALVRASQDKKSRDLPAAGPRCDES